MAEPNNVKSIFLAASEKPAAERAAFLYEATAGDTVLARVEALLKAHDDPDSFLNLPQVNELTIPFVELSERPGSKIGRYKLLEQIGEGGFGVVFMAEQTEPVQRKVALKIIKPGMDTRQVVARFEAERRRWRMMDHPHIAKVLDAGATDDRPPVFRDGAGQGRPDHPVLRRASSGSRQRLELFVHGVPGRPACASEGDHPPRHEAHERAGGTTTTSIPRPWSSTLAWPRRSAGN